MMLRHAPPLNSLPPAKSSWKITKTEDVINLLKVVQGLDPAWRFLEVRQLSEIRNNIAAALPKSQWDAAIKNQPAAIKLIQEAIGLAKASGAPFLARDMCVAQTARERLAQWGVAKEFDFDEGPVGLRLLLNVRTRPSNRRLIDNHGIAASPDLKESVRRAEHTGWLEKDPASGLPVPSDEARAKVIGAFRASLVSPTGTPALAAILKVPEKDMAKLGQEVLKLAESDLQTLFKPLSDASEASAVNTSTGVSTKMPIIEYALEVFDGRSRGRPIRQQLIQASIAAMGVLDDPSVRSSRQSRDFLTKVAEMCLPQDKTGVKFASAEYYMNAWKPILCELKSGFQSFIPTLKFYTSTRNFDPQVKEHRGFILQREAVSLVGHWLSRNDIPTDVKEALQQILAKGAHPFTARLTVETALHWVLKNHDRFTTEQLKSIPLEILSDLDRNFLHHSLYISGVSARKDGRPESLGALEMVIELVKMGRYGVDEACEAYRRAGMYKILRDRETGNGLWIIQRSETEAMMAELDTLCGGEPKKRYQAEIDQMAEARRLERNEKVRVSKVRSDRLRSLAGKIMAQTTGR